jgi:hypothetical protein
MEKKMPITKNCNDCGNYFVTEYSRSSTCLICWKRERDYTLSKADLALELAQEKITQMISVQAETGGDPNQTAKIIEQTKEIGQLKLDISALRRKLTEAQITIANYRADKNQNNSSGLGLTKKFVIKLLTLCHPDKHGGNDESATEATKELLRIRKLL